ncbi:hypothetical protein BDQ12DRAFT_441197 [Crucibulum laeve]|uniref:Uncharacterized protein n=1 Tax=Crucibulum laeve TaxID=68775 RepID=A0A5C3LL64_9AGAR|nr:hypothetical protein BDQ12DRAFT_441197 [Crucibulum laeve]
MLFKFHKKHSPIHTRSPASSRPTTPATHPGTAESLASTQSQPQEQSGPAASADRKATSDMDVARLLPLRRVLKKLFNRSGSRVADKGAQRTATIVTWAAVKDTLRFVVSVSDVFPPLKSATAGVLVVIERVEAVDDNKKELSELNEKLKLLIRLLETSEDEISPSLHGWINGLARSFEEKSNIIENKMNDHYMKRLLDSRFDASFIMEELQSLTFAIDIILVQANLKIISPVIKMTQNGMSITITPC